MVVRDRQQEHSQAGPASPGSRRHDDWRDDWDDNAEREDEAVDPLSHAEAVRLLGERALRPSRMTPGKVVVAQIVVTLLSALAWAMFAGAPGPSGWSAFFGGMACFVPSGFFALRLYMSRAQPSVGGLVAGEAIKVFGTVALLVLVIVLYRELRWVPLLVTFLLALKTYWVALAIR
ncbi:MULTISPECIES: ATP synthase subunit I [unclassified Cupriavidus]|uniref:ATP synthase subunit I n=1 Tax=unclassified Cupriavidus TaxID=2640874 RepID=UPI0028B70E5C|nr:ATP synthase subunit I [Cupriavidus sp. SZY C1]MDT6962191.1 ATP synthase subunit I [Cupriavidus sp. SZY C1]